MKLSNIEFSCTPDGSVEVRIPGQPIFTYEREHVEFTTLMLERIKNFYTEAYKALTSLYADRAGNKIYYHYLIVHRFIRCNFHPHDMLPDIDLKGSFRFEFVTCPLRGECKYDEIICQPKFNSSLSARESEVMELYCDGYNSASIADILHISIKTVETHKSNALRKYDLHSLVDFVNYASDNNLF